MRAEGEIYRLHECARTAVLEIAKQHSFMQACINQYGINEITDTLANILRKRHGNEASSTFDLTPEDLGKACRDTIKIYFERAQQTAIQKGILDLSLGEDGQITPVPKGKS